MNRELYSEHPGSAQVDDVSPQLSGVDFFVYREPANTKNRPADLIGREPLIERVVTALDQGRRVLLYGFGGNGKTSIAATVADRRVSAGRGPYAWLRVGHANEDGVFEAFLTEFASSEAEHHAIRRATGESKRMKMRNILAKSRLTLVVLDDVWIGSVLFAALSAIPDEIPVIVTSRTSYPTGRGGLDAAEEVGNLSPADALRLLVKHAGEDRCQPTADAEALCRRLGYHAMAVEIAGCLLSHRRTSPADLLKALGDMPHDIQMPGGFADKGRDSVTALLDQSYRVLQAIEALVLKALGAMSGPAATVELLATYLGADETPVWRALTTLTDLSLARRSAETTLFTIHDLTFSYARALQPLEFQGYRPMIRAVRDFVRAHVDEHDLLALDLANVLGGAARARDEDSTALVSILGDLASGGFVGTRGHGYGLLALLDDAIEAARREASLPRAILHQLLSKRGNAHVELGESAKAIPVYREAFDLSPSPYRSVVLLAVMGRVLFELNEQQEAHTSFADAYALAEVTGDSDAMLRVLEQHSIAAFRQRNFELARQIGKRGIDLSQALDNPTMEVSFLTNLGSAEFEIGVRASLGRHQEARAIAARIHDDEQLALAERALGLDHHALNEFEEAQAHLGEALRLYEALGHKKDENDLRIMMDRFHYQTGFHGR